MKQVDFYLLKNAVNQGRFKLASRLAKKLQSLQQKTLVVLDNPTATSELDALMWSFSDTSFVAHDRVPANPPAHSKTHLAQLAEVSDQVLATSYDVLINLSSAVPPFCHRFARTVEVIESDEAAKVAGRERFKLYKSKGFEIKTHDIEL